MRLSLGAACTRRKDTRDRDDRRPSAMNQLVREQRRNSIHPSPSNSDNRPSGGVHRPLCYTTTSSQADRGKNRQKDEMYGQRDGQAGGRKEGRKHEQKERREGGSASSFPPPVTFVLWSTMAGYRACGADMKREGGRKEGDEQGRQPPGLCSKCQVSSSAPLNCIMQRL